MRTHEKLGYLASVMTRLRDDQTEIPCGDNMRNQGCICDEFDDIRKAILKKLQMQLNCW